MIPLRTITVDVPDCPTVPDPTRLPPLYYVGTVGAIIVIIAAVVATGIVRFRAWKEKTEQRQIDANAEVALAKNRRHCPTCGYDFNPAKEGSS